MIFVVVRFGTVKFVINAFGEVILVNNAFDIVTLVAFKFERAVFDEEILVVTKLVTVAFEANKPPLVKEVLILAVPLTSKLNAGDVVLIPTLPPVVKIFPIVLLFPVAVNVPVINATPAVRLVSNMLVVVIFTAVKVPAITTFPDKLIEPPVIVVAARYVVPNVENAPTVAFIVPVVILVVTKLTDVIFVFARLVIVLFIAWTLIDDTEPDVITLVVILELETFTNEPLDELTVDANREDVVIPLVALIVPDVMLLNMLFVIVLLPANKLPVLTLVVASNVFVVMLVPLIVPLEKLEATRLLTVDCVALKFPVLIDGAIKFPDKASVPEVMLVKFALTPVIFVKVMFPAVKLDVASKFATVTPDTFKVLLETFVKVPFNVANAVALTVPVLTLDVARIVPAVSPTNAFRVFVEIFVMKAFVKLVVAAFKEDVLIDVLAAIVPVVSPTDKINTPAEIFVKNALEEVKFE